MLVIVGPNGKRCKVIDMSQTTVRIESRSCATCKNWKAARSIDRLGSARVVRCQTERRPCGVRAGTSNPPGGCCGNWSKWGRI